MRKITLLLVPLAILLGALLPAEPAVAANPVAQFAACKGGSSFLAFPAWDACLDHDGKSPVIKGLNDIWKIAFPLVESIIRAAAYVAVIMIIWGGIKYIQSQGDAKKLAAAKTTIINAATGLVICILSVAIVRFIADRF